MAHPNPTDHDSESYPETITFRGRVLTIDECVEITRLSSGTIRARIRRGWDAERIIRSPAYNKPLSEAYRKIVSLQKQE